MGLSHVCSEFSQSSYFLEFQVKHVFRIKYLESFYVIIDEDLQMCTDYPFSQLIS